MKLKRTPEDFQVEELTTRAAEDRGGFRLYRLTKRGIGTIEAVEAICRRWNLAGRRVSYGGLKDRHAVTIQYLTILDGPDRSAHDRSYDLEPLGLTSRAYGPADFRGNRFRLVLRDLTPGRAEQAMAAAGEVPSAGVPNYFDDQRFGSVGFSGEFIAAAWLKGDHERALFLALAEPTPFDRSDVKAQKVILRECWGKWAEAKGRLERSSTRSIVTYLVDHPTDFRGAFARLKRELRTLYFSAFQSHLWNLWLSRRIEGLTTPDDRVMLELKTAALAFPRRLDARARASLESMSLPLPSARTPAPEGSAGEEIAAILEPFGLAWNDLRVRHLKDVFLSKGGRRTMVFPEGFQSGLHADELHPGRRALVLSFELDRGSYATILVKRITELAGDAP